MKRRSGYVTVEVSEDVDVCDILNEVRDEDLIEEIKDRKLEVSKTFTPSIEVNYRSICDTFGVSYYTPIPDLMKLLELKLNIEKIN